MKKTFFPLLGALWIIISLGFTSWAMEGLPPPEPNEEFLVNEDINIVSGLYFREYSLSQNGVVDYRTARQIIISEYNGHWNSVVHTKEYPLFYWHDSNQDGQFDMWVDKRVEGCSCDVVPYQAVYDQQATMPSGTTSPSTEW